jgi:hypothetical protein
MVSDEKYASATEKIYKEILRDVEFLEKLVDEVIEKKSYDQKGIRMLYEILDALGVKIFLRKTKDTKYDKLEKRILELKHKVNLILEKFEEPPIYY